MKFRDDYEIFATSKKKVSKDKVKIKLQRTKPCTVNIIELDGEQHYSTSNGVHVIVGQGYVVIKMPYSLSVMQGSSARSLAKRYCIDRKLVETILKKSGCIETAQPCNKDENQGVLWQD